MLAVTQCLSPPLGVLAMLGGSFIQIQLMPPAVQTRVRFSPVYGLGQLAAALFRRDASRVWRSGCRLRRNSKTLYY